MPRGFYQRKIVPIQVVEERFWKNVVKTDTCWLWKDGKITTDYGRIYVNHNVIGVHRFSYEIHKGKIPKGLTIDHLCRNTLCVNPSHLEAVTREENVLRGIGAPAQNARKVQCQKGHDPKEYRQYTYRRKGTYYTGRRCNICYVNYHYAYRKNKRSTH